VCDTIFCNGRNQNEALKTFGAQLHIKTKKFLGIARLAVIRFSGQLGYSKRRDLSIPMTDDWGRPSKKRQKK